MKYIILFSLLVLVSCSKIQETPDNLPQTTLQLAFFQYDDTLTVTSIKEYPTYKTYTFTKGLMTIDVDIDNLGEYDGAPQGYYKGWFFGITTPESNNGEGYIWFQNHSPSPLYKWVLTIQ